MKKLLVFIIVIFFIIFALPKKTGEDKVVLRFSSWGSQSEVVILKKLIQEFEDSNKDIKIDFIHVPQNYFQKIHLLFASNLEPDVIFINNQYIQMYIAADLLEDLSLFVDKRQYYNTALNCFMSDSKLYAIPRDISNLVIYYNKEIFKRYNVKPEQIKTLIDLRNAAVKLTNNKHFGINCDEETIYWAYFLASNGGGIISDNKKDLILTRKESIEALNLYADLINKDHAAPSKSQIGSLTTAQMFINQKLAMYISGRWMVPKFRDTIKFDWDIIEFPVQTGNKVYIDSSGWAVSKKSKHKKEAIRFIKFLSSEYSSEKFAQTGLIIPARINSAEKFLYDSTSIPESSYIFINMLKKSKPFPVNENYAVINDILKEKLQELFTGKKRAEEVIDSKIKKKIESLL